ncbi:hypothetical protein ACIQU6_39660 [Streptomyces sp. NPDC090442]|uniref:hypothetical protein n=1 Tax=Streptomyces sp. NPDC090442 TaxID=3365962 RepID=UPI0038251861
MTNIEQIATPASSGSARAALSVIHNLADHVFGQSDYGPRTGGCVMDEGHAPLVRVRLPPRLAVQ